MSILIILILILLNGLFAMAEIAVVSANKLRLQQKAEGGSPAAQRALALAQNPTVFLSTVQIGITLVGIFNGAYGAATLSGGLAELLARVPVLAQVAQPLAFGLLVVVITYLSLVIGELVPKRIALASPEAVAMGVGGFMTGLARFTRPVVQFLGFSTNVLLRLLRVSTTNDDAITDEEIDMVIAQGLRAGVIEPAEQEIIENAFWLGERSVNAIMTPRHDLSWLDLSAGDSDVLELVREEPHGRYLVCDGDLDKTVGYVAIRDLLEASLEGRSIELRSALRKPLLVPETMPILALLEEFQKSSVHIAVVLDEYGGVEGLVTLTDILEELVGSAMVAGEGELAEVEVLGEQRWRVSGGTHIDDVLKLLNLGVDVLPGEPGYHTLGGFMAEKLGRVPQAFDEVFWSGYGFHVESMEGLRVDQVEIYKRPDEPLDEPGTPASE
ncbi:MAG: hemolysin family protein [Trueperaceae bacterium]